MKPSLLWYIIALLVLIAPDANLHAAPPAPDPLIGNWFWHHNISVEFKADGTATSNANSSATWEFLKNAEVQRKYRVNWDHGKYIDTVILSEDGKTALLVSKLGKFNIRRKTD